MSLEQHICCSIDLFNEVMGLTVILILAGQESNIWIGKQPEKQFFVRSRKQPTVFKDFIKFKIQWQQSSTVNQTWAGAIGSSVDRDCLLVFLKNFWDFFSNLTTELLFSKLIIFDSLFHNLSFKQRVLWKSSLSTFSICCSLEQAGNPNPVEHKLLSMDLEWKLSGIAAPQ